MMKKLHFTRSLAIAAMAILIILPGLGWGQTLLTWKTYGNSGTETEEPSVTNDANISASNLTQGSITAAANGNRFGGSGWFNTGNTAAGNTLTEAIAGNDYIQFIVTPNSGFSFTPTSFIFSWQSSGTGPKGVTLRSSADAFAADLGSAVVSNTLGSKTIAISGLTALTTATTFRLYGYGSTATGGTGGLDVSLDVVSGQLDGTTAATGGNPIVATPTFSPAAGTFYTAQNVSLSCTTPESSIYYTVNGTDPDNVGNGTLYSSAIPVSATATIKAIAYATGFDASSIATAVYTFPVAATTTIPYTEDFTSGFGNTYAYSVLGASKVWTYNATDGLVNINGFSGAAIEEDWLILPGINLNNYSNEVLSFDTKWQYGTNDADNYLKLMYSTDYAGLGDPSLATWTELSYTQPSVLTTWTASGDIDLSAISGTSAWIAYKYRGTTGSYRSWSVDNISISSITPAAPTTQASEIVFSSVASTSATASWTNGNGAKRAVFVKQANTGTATPADNTTYTANAAFASGTQIGSTGWYCVYNGTGTSVAISGLTAATDYMVHVCEYNGAAGSELYNVTSGTNNPLTQTTSASAIAPSITTPTATAITSTSATLGGDITSDGGSAITERGTVWSLTTPVTIDNNKLAEGTTATGVFTQSRTSLPSGTLIYYAAYATNGIGTTLSDEASFTTLKAEPTNHVSGFAAATVTPAFSSIDVTWTADATEGTVPDGYVVKASTVDYTSIAVPANGTPETAGALVQLIAPGTLVAHFTGLANNTPYYFAIFPYTNSGTAISYKTASAPQATATTTAPPPPPTVWVNEIHYDNNGTDANESVEVVLQNSGDFTLSDIAVVLMNGSGGASYNTKTLDLFTVGSTYGNYTIYTFTYPVDGIQNGGPDGVAISYLGTLISGQFLSYEGTFTGTTAPCNGVLSTDIGVSENNTSTPSGNSLQLAGAGTQYSAFTWQSAAANTLGVINTNQSFFASTTWDGSESADWNVAGNWDNGVPVSESNAIIPNVTNNPTISTTANCKDLTIEAAAAVIIKSGGSFIAKGTSTGYLNVQRTFIGGTKFQLFCLPVSEGLASALPFFDNAYLDKYVEANGAWTRLVNGDAVESKRGYSINYEAASTELTFSGSIYTSDQVFGALSFTGAASGYGSGWHLLGNPFTSAVNTTLGNWAKTNVDPYIYVWNATTDQFNVAPTDGILTTLTGNIIPAMQGFFVHATAADASITVPEAARIHSSQAFYKTATASQQDALFLTVEGNGFNDKAIVAFNPEATIGFDSQYDAYKLMGGDAAPQLYSILPGNIATINSLPSLSTTEKVSLGLKVGASNTYTLNVEGINSMDASIPIRLDDNKLGTSHDLRINPVYTFTAEPGDAENRFNLNFTTVTAINDRTASGVNIISGRSSIRITNTSMLEGTVYVYSASGQLIAQSVLTKGENLLRTNATGVYVVKVVTNKTIVTGKVVVNQ